MILVNNPGSWDDIYAPLRHAAWDGWTFTDTVFPFFLWISGVAMMLSFARRRAEGATRASLLTHVFRRSVIIFALGFGLNLLSTFSFETVRIPGVLQRIAVCYLCAGAIALFHHWRGVFVWILALTGSYAVLMGLGGGFEPGHNFAQRVDEAVLSGHMWAQSRTWDPEGIVSTLPAIATVLFGVLAGRLLQTALPLTDKAAWLMSAGTLLAGLGHFLSFWMPINKSLWTSTFALLMAGWAALIFGVWLWISDVQGYSRWCRPLIIYGSNAIVIFVLSGLLARVAVLTGAKAWLMRELFSPLASPVNASLLYALANVLLLYLVAWTMFRRGWFVRL